MLWSAAIAMTKRSGQTKQKSADAVMALVACLWADLGRNIAQIAKAWALS